MNRYLSIFMLLSRSVLYKLTALLTGTAALHTAVYFLLCSGRSIEAVYDHWGMRAVFGGGLVLTTALLVGTLSRSGSRLDYTIRRLRIRSGSLWLCQAVFNTACFLVFWAAEVCVALLLCRLWVNTVQAASHQTVYLAFYRSQLLHSLLPLDDLSRWVRDIVLFAGLGICTACATVIQRRGSQHWVVLVLPVVTAFVFPSGIGVAAYDGLLACGSAAAAFGWIVNAWGEEFQIEN